MRCTICGKEIERYHKVDSDGVEKRIAYCRKCVHKVLRSALGISERGIALIAAYANIVQDSPATGDFVLKEDLMDVFVKMPVSVLSIMFIDDGSAEERKRMEMYTREMVYLQRRLESAVRKEDYKKASELKKKIQKLREILEKK